MAMRPVGGNPGYTNMRWLTFGKFFRKDPKAVPQIVPPRKKARRDKLADVRRDAKERLKAIDDYKVHYKINQRNKNVAAGDLGLVSF